jgi:hypothetical protein
MNAKSNPFVAMLEDDRDRIERFTRVLQSTHPSFHLIHWRTATAFITNYAVMPGIPQLIALDHDLFADNPNDPDPGDGREVSAYLTTQVPRCPILIHSTNSVAADSMLFSLRDAGWTVDRISPLGSDWIEAYWYPIAMEMIGDRTPSDPGL